MATTHVFAIGKLIATQPPVIRTDSRLAELLDWRRETGKELPLPADLILWLEDRGYVVDLHTGAAMQVGIARVTPSGKAVSHLLTPASEREVDALIDEVYGKPGLGVEDSAGLFDEADSVADAYELGQADHATGRYSLPAGYAEHDAYIRGQNDAWAKARNVTWWRRSEQLLCQA